jgi:hypothetical protein
MRHGCTRNAGVGVASLVWARWDGGTTLGVRWPEQLVLADYTGELEDGQEHGHHDAANNNAQKANQQRFH